MWPSGSNAHFTDMPHESSAFREIETLYDNGALATFGIKPLRPEYGSWDRKPSKNVSYDQKLGRMPFHPSKPVTWKELVDVIRLLQRRSSRPK